MLTLKEVRAQYPGAQDLSDDELIDVLANRYGTDKFTVMEAVGYKPEAGVFRTAGDMAVKGAQGVVDLGQSVVGLASLVTGGKAGEAMRSIGYDPERTNKTLGEFLSTAQQVSENKVQSADGFVNTVATALQNPRAIAGSVAESMPGMFAAGAGSSFMARSIAAKAAAPFGGLTTAEGAAAAKAAVDAAANRLMWAGAAGEGAQTAGQIADQAQGAGRQFTDYAGPALAAGAGTAVIGRAAGKLMGDAETALFTGSAGAGIKGGLAARVGKGIIGEGLLEEMPQSAQEQMFTNLAMGKPAMEGVGNAAGIGLVTGAAMGAGMGALQKENVPIAERPPAPKRDPIAEIGSAPNLDAAAAAATAAVDEVLNEPAATPPAGPSAFTPPASLTNTAIDFTGGEANNAFMAAARERLAQQTLTGQMPSDLMGGLAPANAAVLQSAQIKQEDRRQTGLEDRAMADMERQAARDFAAQRDLQDMPKSTSTGVIDGDIMNSRTGEPFKTAAGAKVASAKTPGEVVKVTGGFVVRPSRSLNVSQPAAIPPVATGADRGGNDQPDTGMDAGVGLPGEPGQAVPAQRPEDQRAGSPVPLGQAAGGQPAAGAALSARGFIAAPNGYRVRISRHQRGSNVLDPTADIGAFVYELRKGDDDSDPLTMVLSKGGKLVVAKDAFTNNASNGTAWVPQSEQSAAKVAGLLVERAQTAVGSPERKAVDAKIAEAVAADQAGGRSAPAGDKPAEPQQAESDPLVPDDILEDIGYDEASPEVKAEFRALMDMAATFGIDTDTIIDDASRRTQDATETDYYRAAIGALQEAIAGSDADGRVGAGQDGGTQEGPAEGLTAQPAQGEGRAPANESTPESIDYKGFKRIDKDGGAFDLTDGNMTVRVEPMGSGKYQASFRGAKSSPHIQGEQGAVDWAAQYRADGSQQTGQLEASKSEAIDKALSAVAVEVKNRQGRDGKWQPIDMLKFNTAVAAAKAAGVKVSTQPPGSSGTVVWSFEKPNGDAYTAYLEKSGKGTWMSVKPATSPAPKQENPDPRPTDTKVQPGDSEEIRKAKADLMAGLGDLASLLTKNTRMNIVPEQEQQLLPILTRIMDASLRLGYHSFKDAAKFTLDKIREMLGGEIADAITLDHLQGAYIGMAGRHKDVPGVSSKREVIEVEDKAEVEAHTIGAGANQQPDGQKVENAPAPDDTQTDSSISPKYKAGDRVVPDLDVIEGDIVRHKGQLWMARVKRGVTVPLAPIVDGKPQVNADSVIRVDLNDNEVIHTGRNIYGYGGQSNEMPQQAAAPDAAPQRQPAQEADEPALTKEQRKQVLDSLVDVYRTKGAPKEFKRFDNDGREIYGYAYSPDLFEKSDITGAMVRYYVTLPDGRLAHPTELFPNYTQSDIDAEMAARESRKRDRQSDVRRATVPAQQFSTVREAVEWWDKRSRESARTATGLPTIFPSAERMALTDGSKFIMVPATTSGELLEAFAEAGWRAPAEGRPESTSASQPAQQAEPSAPAKAGATPIQNFGEALPPARRSMAAKLTEDLTDEEIAKRPFSEIWPLAENEAIEDTFAAAVAHAARAEVPAKPRQPYKLRQYVEKVKMLRGLAGRIVSGEVTRERMNALIETQFTRLKDWWAKVQLLETLPRDQWKRIETVEERPDSFSYDDDKQVPAPMVRIRVDGRSHWLTGDVGVDGAARGTVAGNRAGVMALLGAAEPEARMKFEIRQSTRTGEVFINKEGDKERRRLMTFATVEEARAALNEQYDSLVGAWEAVKARDNITERDLRNAENRPRVGKDHRNGKDVTVEQFQNRFGFRGGEFGKWVQQGKGEKERQALLNSTYDALMDLSDLLNLPPRAMSLNGSLGIALGSRGSGWASAHYEPSNLVINLTKTRGAGTLAHEWFHALDNYFSRLRRDGAEAPFTGSQTQYRNENYITHRPETLMVRKDRSREFQPLTQSQLEARRERHKSRGRMGWPPADAYDADKWERDPSTPYMVRPEVEARFVALVNALKDSPMAKRAALLDKGSGYWSRTLELAARAFESYIIARMHEQGYHNDFLVNVKKSDEMGVKDAARYPYLLAGEVKPIADAFDALFGEIQTREDDAGNVAMFSRAIGQPGSMSKTAVQSAVDELTSGWANAPDVEVIASMEDAPERVRAEWQRQNSQGATGDIEGFHWRGKVYLVAKALGTDSDTARVLFHEALGHYGLRGVFGKLLNPILRQVGNARPKEMAAKAEQYGLAITIEDARAAIRKEQPSLRGDAFEAAAQKRMDEDRLTAAEELLAEVAQARPELGIVKRAIAAIRTWLRENIPGMQSLALTDDEIVRNFILPARNFVERGKQGPDAIAAALAFSRSYQSPVWYSELARRVEQVKMNAAPVEAWNAWLRGQEQKGVKPDEIEWSGIRDWLAMQSGKVTRQQVLDYLNSNGVQVQETVLSDAPTGNQRDRDTLRELGIAIEVNPEDPGIIAFSDEENPGDFMDADDLENAGYPERAVFAARRIENAGRNRTDNAKYGNYTLPGGENYREVLLTLPAKSQPKQALTNWRAERFSEATGADYDGWNVKADMPDGTVFRSEIGLEDAATADAAIAAAKRVAGVHEMTDAGSSVNYRSNHWDQPNVLAHIRLNDRTDAEGNRVLFVEEIQSDWGQEGKKKGFVVPADTTGFTAERIELYGEPYWKVRNASGEHFYALPAAGVDTASEAIRNAAGKAAKHEGGPPAAPFVTATDKWLSLALKRIIKMAVDEGYDRVAFVTGEQSANRYGLSKQVDSVRITRVGADEFDVAAAVKGGGRGISETGLSLARLEDTVGKDLAKRATTLPEGVGETYTDTDLKVGGEGMKAFYDRIVPAVAKDVLRKLGGGQLEGVNILIAGDKVGIDGMRTGAKRIDQPGFTITDKMREQAADGVPMFQRGTTDPVTNDKDVVGKSQGGRSADDISPGADATAIPDDVQQRMVDAYNANIKDDLPSGYAYREVTRDDLENMFGDLEDMPEDVQGAIAVGGKMFEGVTPDDHFVWAEKDAPGETKFIRDYVSGEDLGPQKVSSIDQIFSGDMDQMAASDAFKVLAESEGWDVSRGVRYFEMDKPNSNPVSKDEGYSRVTIGVRISDHSRTATVSKPDRAIDIHINMAPDSGKGNEFHHADTWESAVRKMRAARLDDEGNLTFKPNESPAPTAGGAMFSRAADPSDASTFAARARDVYADLTTTAKTFNWWNNTVGTQYQKAQQDRQFKRVFDSTQEYILDVSRLANDAADRARDLLPKMENFRDVLKDLPGIDKDRTTKADVEAIGKAIFQGTLADQREYKPAELRSVFQMTDKQIGLYQQFRAAVNKSLDDLTTTIAAKMIRNAGIPEHMFREELATGNHAALAKTVGEWVKQDPNMAGLANQVAEVSDRAKRLKAEGYAPLMRFGQYAVSIRGEAGELLEFRLFEQQRLANKAAREARAAGKDAGVSVMSTQDYKLLKGINPESLELFGDLLEKAGVFDARDEVFQTYIREAIDQRSAMKRMLERHGYPGYSTDVRRVLASFLTSNARLASKNLHFTDMLEAVENIPKSRGDVRDDATNLVKYVQEPTEEAPKLRALLFAQYIGGNVASAMVNMTQSLTMTLPYLSQFGTPASAAKALASAMRQAAAGKVDGDLGEALARAEQAGVVSPQEIHHLNAEAMGTFGSNPIVQKAMFLWGSLFSLAEQFNRRVAFIAAYNMAPAGKSAYDFAVKAVEETQGIYNRGNRPNWARGAVGATLFTFKQFSVSYLEFLSRLPKREKVLALAILMLAAGAEGLPFADDLDDVIDTIAQRLGYSFNSKEQKRRFIGAVLGQGGAEFVLRGASAVPGMPIDISQRMGMANLLPGTGMLRKDVKDHMRDVVEFFGPVGGLAQNAARGELRPTAIANLGKAIDMFQTGMYRDDKGRRVVDVDAVDAAWKAIGFQPAVVAQTQMKTRMVQQDINLAKTVEAEIADSMAEARFERDPAKLQDARDRLKDWNEKNPDDRIRIDGAQIVRRLREMRKTREERIIKSAPREMRQEVRSSLQ